MKMHKKGVSLIIFQSICLCLNFSEEIVGNAFKEDEKWYEVLYKEFTRKIYFL